MPRRDWRRPILAAAAIVAFAAVFGVSEALVRWTVSEDPAWKMDSGFASRSLGYLGPCMTTASRAGQPWLVETQTSRGNGVPAAMPRARTLGVPRVAIVGESSGHLLGQEFDQLTLARPCGVRYEVLLCAQPGSGLEHMARRFDEVMTYQPDAVVVVFGHNLQFMFPLDPGRLRLRVLRDRSRLLTLMAGLFGRSERPPIPMRAARLARFESFLRYAARTTRRAGVHLMATTPADNLWMPPGAQREEVRTSEVLDALYRETLEGPGPAASALAGVHGSPYVDFIRGVLLARTGDTAGAGVSLRAALDGDQLNLRAPTSVAEMLRRVAPAEGITLRDTARVVEEAAPGGLPGWESFWDNCHLRSRVFAREAGAVLDLVRGTPPGGSLCGMTPRTFDHTFREQLEGMVGLLSGDPAPETSSWLGALSLVVEHEILTRGVPGVLDVQTFANSPRLQGDTDTARRVRVLVALAEGLDRAGQHSVAETFNTRARDGGGPSAAVAWVQRGIFLLRQGDRIGARGAFQQALVLEPRRADAQGLLDRVAAPAPALP